LGGSFDIVAIETIGAQQDALAERLRDDRGPQLAQLRDREGEGRDLLAARPLDRRAGGLAQAIRIEVLLLAEADQQQAVRCRLSGRVEQGDLVALASEIAALDQLRDHASADPIERCDGGRQPLPGLRLRAFRGFLRLRRGCELCHRNRNPVGSRLAQRLRADRNLHPSPPAPCSRIAWTGRSLDGPRGLT
jgi:hypothetical protein